MHNLSSISKLVYVYSRLEFEANKGKRDCVIPIYIGCEDLSQIIDTVGVPTAMTTSLEKFIYHGMKNKYFGSNQDYTDSDTGLIAILDVIKATRDNCAGDLKLDDKGSFFHLSSCCRSMCMRLRIRIILFIRSMHVLVIDQAKTKNSFKKFK